MKLADLKAYIEHVEEEIEWEAAENKHVETNPDVFLFTISTAVEHDFKILRSVEDGNIYLLEK